MCVVCGVVWLRWNNSSWRKFPLASCVISAQAEEAGRQGSALTRPKTSNKAKLNYFINAAPPPASHAADPKLTLDINETPKILKTTKR